MIPYSEWALARRYLWSKRRHPFVGVISFISVLGIAVGVAALIVTLGVMSGFDDDLKQRIIGLRAHASIEKNSPFTDSAAVAERLRRVPGITGVSPYVDGQALLQKDSWGTGILLRGLDPVSEKTVSRFHEHLSKGVFTGAPGKAVIGLELSRRARLPMGSEFQLLTQNADKPAVFTVEGIFSSGMYEYDANLVFTGLAPARELYLMKEAAVSGLSIRLRDAEAAPAMKAMIEKGLGAGYETRTWMEMNKTLFAALKLEKVVMFLILALIIFVACLNIAGCLTILVMDKTKDIGVLKALGARSSLLLRVFTLDGFLIGLIGSLAGLALGLGLGWALKTYPIVELPSEIYYINRLPVKMTVADSLAVVGAAVALSFLSSLYPAWMAARLHPVQALRYE